MIKIMKGLQDIVKDHPELNTQDLLVEYVEEYEKILANTQLKMNKPLTDLLPTNKDQYFHIMNRIGEVAYHRIEKKYKVKE